jgi:hypothetical protein
MTGEDEAPVPDVSVYDREVRIAVALALVAALGVTPPAAAECPPRPARAEEFRPDTAGAEVAPVGRCGGFVLTTDGSAARFSWGAAVWQGNVPPDYELRVRVRRLTPDVQRTFELFVPGGAVLVRSGEVAFYESEAQFALGGWHPVPGLDLAVDQDVVVRHRGRDAVLVIGGRELLRHRFSTRPVDGGLRLGMKGYRGLRARVLVSSFAVVPIAAQ